MQISSPSSPTGSLRHPSETNRKNSGPLPWIDQNGNRIFYSQVKPGELTASRSETESDTENSGPPAVILHHGLAQWGDDWANAGWPGVLGSRQVFALDALGHGRSDRPSDRVAYSVEKRAEAVLQIADAERLGSFAFFGFSMGGRVGVELAASHPSRVERLIVGGMHGLKPSIDRRNLERRIAVLRSAKWRLVERAVGAKPADGRNNDSEPLALSTEAVLDWHGADDRLPELTAPTLIFCGVQDSLLDFARQTAGLMPNSTFAELPSTGHAASFYSSDRAKKLVQDFLSSDSI